jgi:hypothetical protein
MARSGIGVFSLIALGHFALSVSAAIYTFSNAMEGATPTLFSKGTAHVADVLTLPFGEQAWFAFVLNSGLWAALLTLLVQFLRRRLGGPKVAV